MRHSKICAVLAVAAVSAATWVGCGTPPGPTAEASLSVRVGQTGILPRNTPITLIVTAKDSSGNAGTGEVRLRADDGSIGALDAGVRDATAQLSDGEASFTIICDDACFSRFGVLATWEGQRGTAELTFASPPVVVVDAGTDAGYFVGVYSDVAVNCLAGTSGLYVVNDFNGPRLITDAGFDYIGSGNNSSSPSGVHATVSPRDPTLPIYRLSFVPPQGSPLAVQEYRDAARYPFQNALQPGVDITIGSQGCNTVLAHFDVKRAAFYPSGHLKEFVVAFEHLCEQLPRNRLWGCMSLAGPDFGDGGTDGGSDGGFDAGFDAGEEFLSVGSCQGYGPNAVLSVTDLGPDNEQKLAIRDVNNPPQLPCIGIDLVPAKMHARFGGRAIYGFDGGVYEINPDPLRRPKNSANTVPWNFPAAPRANDTWLPTACQTNRVIDFIPSSSDADLAVVCDPDRAVNMGPTAGLQWSTLGTSLEVADKLWAASRDAFGPRLLVQSTSLTPHYFVVGSGTLNSQITALDGKDVRAARGKANGAFSVVVINGTTAVELWTIDASALIPAATLTATYQGVGQALHRLYALDSLENLYLVSDEDGGVSSGPGFPQSFDGGFSSWDSISRYSTTVASGQVTLRFESPTDFTSPITYRSTLTSDTRLFSGP